MTVEEFNRLIESAYEAGFAYEERLAEAYQKAFARASAKAASTFKTTAVTAAGPQFVAPPPDSLTSGMTDEEQASVDRIRNEAAAAIAASLAALGLTAVAVSFMQAISDRGSLNFEQELTKTVRSILQQGLDNGWSADETAAQLAEAFRNVSSPTAMMLAQTELTSLVNERSLEAAQKQFEGRSAPVYKVWQTMQDARVRQAHATTQGQTVPIAQPFDVGGYAMMFPGDPSAPLQLTARCRCRMTYTESLTAAAGPDVSQLAMIAVYPAADEAETIAVDGGSPPEKMHCTMVFLGDVNEIDMDAVTQAVQAVANATSPMSGAVGGIGMFSDFGDGYPQLALPNVQGLAELRTRLTDALAERGVVSPSQHDWVPHMTLDYVDVPSLPEDLSVLGCPLSFDTISISVADVRADFPLAAQVTASGKEDTLMSVTTTETTNELTATTLTAATITIVTDDAESPAEDAGEPGEEAMADGPAWKALLAVEGEPTGDGRMLAEGSLTWREPPLSLMALDFTGPGGHEGARVAGRIDQIWRDGNEVWASGVFNGDEFGLHIADLVSNSSLKGNSIDPGGVTVEMWNADTMEPFPSDMDAYEAMLEGTPILQVFTAYEIAASTVCPTPAIGEAQIMLASGVLHTSFFTAFRDESEVLTAAGAGMAPLHPPLEWFSNPKFPSPTALTVTPEGRVMGHAALWNSCHIGEPSGPGICVPPPRSGMQYEIFHHGVVETAEGMEVPCGQITMSTFHAGRDLSWKATLEHYEHSGCAVADVVAGEDEFGIWVSGGLRPDLPAERVREMKAGALSGDWRQVIGRGLEFLAALVVNIPGFPIPRPEARIVASAAGEEEVLALVAAGMVTPEDEAGMTRREYLRKIEGLTFRTYTEAERKKMAKNGQALPDGSYPIPDCSAAEDAIHSVGRASDRAEVEAHIRKRVKALGCTGAIFDNWK